MQKNRGTSEKSTGQSMSRLDDEQMRIDHDFMVWGVNLYMATPDYTWALLRRDLCHGHIRKICLNSYDHFETKSFEVKSSKQVKYLSMNNDV